MGRIIPYIMENKKCLKPPTSYNHWHLNWCPSLGDFAPFGRLPRPASQVHRLGGHSLPFQAWPRDSTGFTIQKSWYSGICISMHCIHVCIHIYTYIHIYIYIYIYIYIRILYICIYCIYIYCVYVYTVYIYTVYIYIYSYLHLDLSIHSSIDLCI